MTSALIVGLGSIGMRHARNLLSLGIDRFSGVDPIEDRRSRFMTETGGEAFPSLDAALAGKPDLAVICSPSAAHVADALTAARVGCHLFIEKPLSVDGVRVDELIAEVAERKLFAHVGSNWKFHPAFMAMKELIDHGALGRVTGAQVLAGQWLPDWHPWEDYRCGYSARQALGGGIVFDAHEFDYLTWLLGPAREMHGFTTRSGTLDIETEDVACACLRLASGALVTIHVDYIQRHPRRRYHMSGDRGTIEWDLQDGRVRHYRADQRDTVDIDASTSDLNEMYVAQTRHVLDGVRGVAAPLTPLSAAKAVCDLQRAIKTSR